MHALLTGWPFRWLSRWLLWIGGLAVGVGVLTWSTGPLIQAASAEPEPGDAVALACAAAAWLVCGWLLLGTAAALVEAAGVAVGGRFGQARWPARVAGAVTPSSVRDLVGRTLRTGLALSTVTAVIAGVGGIATPVQATTATAPAGAGAAADDATAPSLPSLDRPATSAAAHELVPPRQPQSYTVTPGDTLWGIAAAHLPRPPTNSSIARAWPLWWHTNRAVIGNDPDLIQPGQVLRVPGGSR